jgi:Na+-driven multidrug efflux pump
MVSGADGVPVSGANGASTKASDDLFLRDVFARYLAASAVGIIGSSISIIGNSVIAGFVLGTTMLPVLSLALPFYYLFATVGAMLGVGGAQICARLIGWQRHAECQRAFSLVYVLAVVLGVLLTVMLLLCIDPLLTMMSAPPSLLGPTRSYLTVLCLSGVFIIGIYPAFNMLRLDGQTTQAALLFVGMGILSGALDLLFLLGFGWGIESIAIALCLSYGATSISGALMLMRRSLNFRFVSPWGARWRDGWRDAFRLVRSIVSTGSPNALEDLCIVARTAVINNVAVVAFGTMALGAYVVIDSVTIIALVFAAGVSGAAMAFLSVFFAERDSRNTMKVLKLAFIWGVPAVVALTLLLELFAPDVAMVFGADTEDERAAFSTAIRVFAVGLPLLLFNYLMITVYQSQGRTAASNAIVLMRELVGPLAFMGVLMAPLGMVSIWVAFPLAEFLTAIMVLLYSFACQRGNRQLSPVFLIDRQVERDGESVSLTVRNDAESIVVAVGVIEAFCERRSLSRRLTTGIQLALEEMLVAIGENSLAGMASHTMNVRVLVLGEEVIVRIRSGGARFNPIEYAERLSKIPLMTKLIDNEGAGETVSVFRHDRDAASDAVPEQDVPLELTGIMMILKMAEVVDYRSTFGVNNLMMILRA